MILDEIKILFSDLGLNHVAKFGDVTKPGTNFDLQKIKVWMDENNFHNGVDYMIDYIDEPDANGVLTIVPVVGFKEVHTAMMFKLTCG
jgi:hypothetical protein